MLYYGIRKRGTQHSYKRKVQKSKQPKITNNHKREDRKYSLDQVGDGYFVQTPARYIAALRKYPRKTEKDG